MSLSLAAFLAVLTWSYASFQISPESERRTELFFDTLFFLLYAAMTLTIPPFLAELTQTPWKGMAPGIVWGLALAGPLVPLMVHALVWDREAGLHWLRWCLNGVYLPLFLGTMAWFFGRSLVYRLRVSDPWKRTTITGTASIFFLGFPLFVIDGFWPVFQLQLGWLPRGANLLLVATLAWNLLFSWRWAVFSQEPPTVTPVPSSGQSSAPTSDQRFADPRGLLDRLSPREREVALLVLEGSANQDIADRLGIRVGTVKVHIYSIFNKSGASSRKEFIRMFLL